MPFTVSHTIAVIPLVKYLGKFGALSALIIGSMTPDFAYLTPYLVNQRMESHSLLGVYLFAIPMGLTIYFLYHLLMAPVIVSVFPKKLQSRLHPDLFNGRLPDIPAYTLIFSLILGALTHVTWDYFTHAYGAPRHLAFLNMPIITIDNYDIMPYRVLQHMSTVLGMCLLSFWIFIWISKKTNKSTPEIESQKWKAPNYLVKVSILLLLLVPAFVGVLNGIMKMPDTSILNGLYSKQAFLRYAIVAWAKAFIITTSLLGLLYQYRIYQDKKK